MRHLIKILTLGLFLTCAPQITNAQTDPNAHLDIVSQPICFKVRNTAPYNVHGSFITDYHTRPDGIRARHRSNFRLEEKGAKDKENGHALDEAEFCTYGPFYPNRKLELVLRTLVPIFSCKTRVDAGEIIISGRRKPEGGTETKALCFD